MSGQSMQIVDTLEGSDVNLSKTNKSHVPTSCLRVVGAEGLPPASTHLTAPARSPGTQREADPPHRGLEGLTTIRSADFCRFSPESKFQGDSGELAPMVN